MNNILITGAAGFIGYNLCKSMGEQENTTVFGIDSLNDAYDNRLKQIRLRDLENNKNFKFENINLSDEIALKSISNIQFDTVFHLAARARVQPSIEEPVFFNATNVEVTVLNATDFTYFSPGDAVSKTANTTGRSELAGNTQIRTYVYTWVTPWDEESIPSLPSNEVYLKEISWSMGPLSIGGTKD